jgi:hypothetical protein
MGESNLGASSSAAGATLALTTQSEPQPSPSSAANGVGWSTLVPRIEYASAALLLVSFGLILVIRAFTSKRSVGFSVRRHSGGFGGSSTGWTFSPSLVALLSGFVLLTLGVAIAIAPVATEGDAKSPDEQTSGATHPGNAGASAGSASGATAATRADASASIAGK